MIQLLDGTKHQEADLIEKMYDDNFYYGYLGHAAFSSSSLKMLLDSPKKYYFNTKYGSDNDTASLNEGRIIHAKALTPEIYAEQYEVIDVASKVSKKWKEESAASNKICLTKKEDESTNRVVDALLKNEYFIQALNKSKPEVPAIGNLRGYPFRAKADILSPKGIFDLKTTSSLKTFPYSAEKYSYDLQAYIYCSLFDVDPSEFEFIVIDKGSLDIAVYQVSHDFVESGRHKLELAIDTYEKFFVGVDEDQLIDGLNNYVFRGTL